MLSSMLTRRIAAAFIAVGTLAMSGCGAPDEARGQRGVDIAFDDLGDLTVTPIPPADVPSIGPQEGEFHDLNAAEISENGTPILKVLAGQLNSGSGDAFVDEFLSELSAQGEQFDPPKTLASSPEEINGHPVTYFHMFVAAEGYAYADGPTVVIAYNVAGAPKAGTAQDALAKILINIKG